MGSYGRKPAVLILMLVTTSAKLLDGKFWKNSWTNSSITSIHWFFFNSWNRFLAELWLGKKGSFTEESDGETAGVLILLAATVILIFVVFKFIYFNLLISRAFLRFDDVFTGMSFRRQICALASISLVYVPVCVFFKHVVCFLWYVWNCGSLGEMGYCC